MTKEGRPRRQSVPRPGDTLSHIRQVLKNQTGEQVDVVCIDCGETFQALNLGPITKLVCDKCGIKRDEKEKQVQEAARKVEEETRYRQLIRMATVPPAWQGVTFDTLDPAIQPGAQRIAKEYAMSFSKASPSLVFFSVENGTGKSTLAACIVNYILHEKRIPVMFKKARDLMLEIRRTFSDRWSGDGEAEILDRVSYAELLVLDDVGVDPPSDWIFTTYWTVLDRRLDWGLPVVITTNKQFEGRGELMIDRIGSGATSRLLGLCQHNIIDLSGEDLR